MTEKEMRQFVECGLVEEHEYELFESIAKDVDFFDTAMRKEAYRSFLYRIGYSLENEHEKQIS